MISWIRIFQHILPRARAWRLTVSKQLRQFFEGLSGFGADAKIYVDEIYLDLYPQQTRELSAWELQFGLGNYGLTEQEQRDRLEAVWAATGGQSPRYIQDTLQAAGFDVYVHEWWEPIVAYPQGGSINGDVTPVARDPFDYLTDTGVPSPQISLMNDGAATAVDGGQYAYDGSQSVPILGYPLVNKILGAIIVVETEDGGEGMQDAGDTAQDGGYATSYEYKQYVMSADTATYPYYFYIGGATFPNTATISEARRDEFEALCLKICPTEQWLGLLIEYA